MVILCKMNYLLSILPIAFDVYIRASLWPYLWSGGHSILHALRLSISSYLGAYTLELIIGRFINDELDVNFNIYEPFINTSRKVYFDKKMSFFCTESSFRYHAVDNILVAISNAFSIRIILISNHTYQISDYTDIYLYNTSSQMVTLLPYIIQYFSDD